jgi:glycosyltransferase A (GT-A) superfamily protein (DUF2064 family)
VAGPALVLLSRPADDALRGVAAWAEASGVAVRHGPPGSGRLQAAVGAFAAGHTAVLLVTGGAVPPEALLDLAVAELAAPMTAVLGPAPGGRLGLLGLNEVAPALLSTDPDGERAVERALALAFEAGLSPVVLAEG